MKDKAFTDEDQKQMSLEMRKKCAGFFFTLAQLVFTAFVIGALAVFFTDFKFSWRVLVMFAFGVIFMFTLFKTGLLYFDLKLNKEEKTE